MAQNNVSVKQINRSEMATWNMCVKYWLEN